jgi:hypothetical protein
MRRINTILALPPKDEAPRHAVAPEGHDRQAEELATSTGVTVARPATIIVESSNEARLTTIRRVNCSAIPPRTSSNFQPRLRMKLVTMLQA